MSKPLKPRRGTTAQNNAVIGEEFEITYDTGKNTIVCRDGKTVGGFPLAKEADVITCKAFQKNVGKSIAVFGGSLSVAPESAYAKNIWKAALGCSVTDYGVGGAGFSSLQGDSLQAQVQRAAQHDIYVLWASSNDYTHGREVGTYTDYTSLDGYNTERLVTQCGGINFCIKYLLETFPSAEIYLFTSTKVFTSSPGHYDLTSERSAAGYTLNDYVVGQRACCAFYGIPVLDQYEEFSVNHLTSGRYYLDGIHLNAAGYTKLGYTQAGFLINGR